MKNFEYFVP